jgi:uncharacterized protein YraI
MKRIIRLVIPKLTLALILFVWIFFSTSLIRIVSAQSLSQTNTSVSTASNPIVHAELTTNCRQGPGTAYKIVGWLVKGESTEVLGRDEGRHWWYIENPTRDGHCWVWAHSTFTDGNTGTVPIIQVSASINHYEEDQGCLLTVCFSGKDEIIYCSCKPAPKEVPKFICHNYGCPIFPWFR